MGRLEMSVLTVRGRAVNSRTHIHTRNNTKERTKQIELIRAKNSNAFQIDVRKAIQQTRGRDRACTCPTTLALHRLAFWFPNTSIYFNYALTGKRTAPLHPPIRVTAWAIFEEEVDAIRNRSNMAGIIRINRSIMKARARSSLHCTFQSIHPAEHRVTSRRSPVLGPFIQQDPHLLLRSLLPGGAKPSEGAPSSRPTHTTRQRWVGTTGWRCCWRWGSQCCWSHKPRPCAT